MGVIKLWTKTACDHTGIPSQLISADSSRPYCRRLRCRYSPTSVPGLRCGPKKQRRRDIVLNFLLLSPLAPAQCRVDVGCRSPWSVKGLNSLRKEVGLLLLGLFVGDAYLSQALPTNMLLKSQSLLIVVSSVEARGCGGIAASRSRGCRGAKVF